MITEFVITNDGQGIFSCRFDNEKAMEDAVSSVEFYAHAGNFVFNFEDRTKDQHMLDIKIEDSERERILSLSNALIAYVIDDDIIQAFDVPFIHIG